MKVYPSEGMGGVLPLAKNLFILPPPPPQAKRVPSSRLAFPPNFCPTPLPSLTDFYYIPPKDHLNPLDNNFYDINPIKTSYLLYAKVILVLILIEVRFKWSR